MLEGCLVQPFVELRVRKLELGECFDFSKNNKLIQYPKHITTFVQPKRKSR
jgi:hypothetical protein